MKYTVEALWGYVVEEDQVETIEEALEIARGHLVHSSYDVHIHGDGFDTNCREDATRREQQALLNTDA